jgi:hypothetical protein
MDTLTDEERLAALDRLRNPRMPNPFFSWDYGVPVRDLPPRRTLRERVRTLASWRRAKPVDRLGDRG